LLIAVPVLGDDVAPRFGVADSFLIAEIEGRRIVQVDRVEAVLRGFVSRLGALRDLEVELLLCGGFNRAFLPLAEEFGIRVVTGVAGEAQLAIEGFAINSALASNRGPREWRRGSNQEEDDR